MLELVMEGFKHEVVKKNECENLALDIDDIFCKFAWSRNGGQKNKRSAQSFDHGKNFAKKLKSYTTFQMKVRCCTDLKWI